jgi:hypothetical protein
MQGRACWGLEKDDEWMSNVWWGPGPVTLWRMDQDWGGGGGITDQTWNISVAN